MGIDDKGWYENKPMINNLYDEKKIFDRNDDRLLGLGFQIHLKNNKKKIVCS